ncbi:MAG: hypothetical protein OQK82_07555 [Candidatus Pacearchaeota archaeon]|nr:hypothetical protein [Candidatus Pacearchaeota archaeon]
MQHWDVLKLDDYLARNPKLRIAEINDQRVVLSGEHYLKARLDGYQAIEDTYKLKFVFDKGYPSKLPQVFDVSDHFPRSQDYHVYKDGSFCLGSEFKIKYILHSDPSVEVFIARIVDPFLYAVSHRIQYGFYPFGELAHGEQGLLDDYEELFGVKGKVSVLAALKALGKRKREANKLVCSCGCGLKLGRCDYRFTLNKWRYVERRRWFRDHLTSAFAPIVRQQKKKPRKSRSR